VRLAARPEQVVFDPGDVILKTVKMEKPRSLWRRQLAAATLGIDRMLAAAALAEGPDPDGVAALGAALDGDSFWGVRAAAARALGRTRRQDALELLLAARNTAHPRVRRAVAASLGEYRNDPRAGAALLDWVRKGDASLFVEGEAALALGKTRAPEAAELLREVANRASFQDIIRARALEGLGAIGGERAIHLLRDAWRPGGAFQSRKALVMALVEAGRGTPHIRAVREFLEDRFDDPDFRVRGDIAAGLARLGDADAVPAIERALAAELDGRARRRMREAITDLREGSKPGEQVVRLQDEVARLRAESSALRERLDRLEGRGAAGRTTPSPTPEAPPVQKRRRSRTRRGRTPPTNRRR
jgi:aminopeptidase N